MSYTIIDLEAENKLQERRAVGRLEVVAIRRPLIHKSGEQDSHLLPNKPVSRGIPLPLDYASSPRAMISIGSLSGAVVEMARVPRGDRMVAIVNDEGSFSLSWNTATGLVHLLA